jgi:formylglycine-generating enzyme required for sulfatase activity
VASFAPNAWWLYDMRGNAFERGLDWLADYSAAEAADPVALAPGASRVYRGGAYTYYGKHCRSAERDGCFPGFTRKNLGLRVVWRP